MSARIVHVTALLPQTHRLLGLPELRVFRGTVRRRAIPRCDGRCGGERLTTSQLLEFLLYRDGEVLQVVSCA